MKQNVIDDFNILSGQQKAAILMLSLDEERSASIFSLMDDEEIKELSVIMASLGKVNSNVVEQLFSEFVEKVSSTGSLVGTYESTERLLSKALDKDRVSNIMEEIRGPAGRTMWDKLGNVNEHVLANYLKNEYPQTIAVILSKIKAEHAAKVIALLAGKFAMEIVMRMIRMDSVQKEVLDGLEKTLRKRIYEQSVQINPSRFARTYCRYFSIRWIAIPKAALWKLLKNVTVSLPNASNLSCLPLKTSAVLMLRVSKIFAA